MIWGKAVASFCIHGLDFLSSYFCKKKSRSSSVYGWDHVRLCVRVTHIKSYATLINDQITFIRSRCVFQRVSKVPSRASQLSFSMSWAFRGMTFGSLLFERSRGNGLLGLPLDDGKLFREKLITQLEIEIFYRTKIDRKYIERFFNTKVLEKPKLYFNKFLEMSIFKNL